MNLTKNDIFHTPRLNRSSSITLGRNNTKIKNKLHIEQLQKGKIIPLFFFKLITWVQ